MVMNGANGQCLTRNKTVHTQNIDYDWTYSSQFHSIRLVKVMEDSSLWLQIWLQDIRRKWGEIQVAISLSRFLMWLEKLQQILSLGQD